MTARVIIVGVIVAIYRKISAVKYVALPCRTEVIQRTI